MLQRAFGAVLLLTLAAAPTQWSLPLPGGVHLTAADLLLALAMPLAIAAGLRPWRLHWTHAAFASLTLPAALIAADRLAAAREWAQIVLYFLVASALADAALRHGGVRWLRRAVGLTLGIGALSVGLALWQYWRGDAGDPLSVRGSFGNRNVLGGYLALLLPLAFGLLLHASTWRVRAALALLILAGLSVILSGPALLAIALVCALLAARRGPAWFAVTAAILLAGHVWVLPHLPRANSREHFASMALYDDVGQPTRRYPEWQAAAVMTLEHPWMGSGLGCYQRQIGPYYGVVPNATGPSEPDIQNLYLVLSATAGLPACLAFGAMLLTAGAAAVRTTDKCAALPGLGAGMAGALAAFALTACWHPLLVRGIGLPLGLLLAAARHAGCRHEEERPCA